MNSTPNLSRLEQAFADEWALARAARLAGAHDRAFHHLERAHILGQRRTWLHVKSHLGMLQLGWQRRDLRELLGQLARIVAAAAFSRVWVPAGNTGGANVSPFKPMPVPPDLQSLLDAEDALESAPIFPGEHHARFIDDPVHAARDRPIRIPGGLRRRA